jgi:hypothetical protein
MTPPQDVGMRFDLPFCLHLQDGFYDLAQGSRTFRIETRKAWRNSQDCSDDDSVAEQRRHFAEGSYTTGQMGESFEEAQQVVGTNMEMVDDPHGRFRYTRVVVWLKHSNPDKIVPEGLLREALEAVNRLVDVFRFISGEAHLPPVAPEDVEYAEIVVPRTGTRFYAGLFGKGITNAVINESRAVHERVREMLASGEEVPLDAELRLAARRLLGQGLWRQAVVDAVSSLEVFLGAELRTLVDACKISEDEFDALMNQPPTERLKAPLRDAVGCSPVDRPSLWRSWIQANKVRRRVVHQGLKTSEREATKVVETVEELVTYVQEHRAG